VLVAWRLRGVRMPEAAASAPPRPKVVREAARDAA
jgi:hypothetical protein